VLPVSKAKADLCMGYYHAQPKPLAALNVSAFGGPGATWNYNYSWVCPIAADATADLTDGNTLKVTLYTVLTTPAAGQVRIKLCLCRKPQTPRHQPTQPTRGVVVSTLRLEFRHHRFRELGCKTPIFSEGNADISKRFVCLMAGCTQAVEVCIQGLGGLRRATLTVPSGGTCSLGQHGHSTLPLTVIDWQSLGIYTVILLSLLSFSVK
jgi:hypothetical protein